MRKYQKKSNSVSFFESWPMLFILFFLVVIVGWGVFGLAQGLGDTIKNKNVARAKVDELTLRKERLVGDIENLETEAGKEKIFRENYGLAKEGEEVIVIVEDKNAISEKDRKKKGVFGAFKNWFSKP